MNYLAHAYLSFEEPDILIGNMISDFIKGKKQFDYLLPIQKGIQLHRAIDEFTDFHPVTKEAKQLLKPASGAYAGAFIDIAYDHFLALDSKVLTKADWELFSANVYRQLSFRETELPEKFRRILPYMISQNWLVNYRELTGIENSFRGLCHRAIYLTDSKPIFELFITQYDKLQNLYFQFFPDVKKFARQRLSELLNA
jgi:acyl carrier protein phosphodiesterase